MVEPIVWSTFGPRVGHEILSSWTTSRRARGSSPAVSVLRGETVQFRPPPYDGTSQAAGGNGFRLFSRFAGPNDLPLIAVGCNHVRVAEVSCRSQPHVSVNLSNSTTTVPSV